MKTIKQVIATLHENPNPKLAGSIYIPTHPQSNSPNVSADKVRFKNALQFITNHENYDKAVLGDAMQKLEALYDDMDFWNHQGRGLAVFFSVDVLEWVKLPFEVTEASYLAYQFVHSPLHSIEAVDTDFYVLDVNLTAPRLLHGSGGVFEVVNQAAMPSTFDDEVGKGEYQKQIQHSPAGQSAYHGHSEEDAISDEINRYLKLIATAVDTFLKDETAPLLLAGTPNRTAAARKALQYSKVIDSSYEGSAEHLGLHDLYEAVRPLVQAHILGQLAASAEHLGQAAPEFVAIGSEEIIEVATKTPGRIESLYLPTYRHTTDSIQPGEDAEFVISLPESADAVEPLVTAVVQQGGAIVPVQIDAYDFLDQPKALCRF